jgi:predicted phage terminase large subunit-like protein
MINTAENPLPVIDGDVFGALNLAMANILDPDMELTPEEQEDRNHARFNMRGMVPYTYPAYKADPFHNHVCDHIDRVVFDDHPDGHLSHLMLFAPPQHGKSHIVSFHTPPFWLAHNPHLPVLLTSYGTSLARRNSYRAQMVFESEQYQQLYQSWGIIPDDKNWRRHDWHLQGNEGYIFATGLDGPMTGHGFGLGVIDDPIRNWADAQSEVIRENAFDWYNGTYITRMWELHRTILMMTRWHEDDLAARILATEGAINECMNCGRFFTDDYLPKICPDCNGPRGKWKVIAYSALAESQADRDAVAASLHKPEGLPDILGRKEGDPLAPSRYSAEYLRGIRARDPGGLVWGAEYQQHPTPPKGDFFKTGRVKIEEMYPLEDFGGQLINGVPVGLKNVVRFWDLAASEKKTGTDPDFTSGTLVGIDSRGWTWALNQVSIQAPPENVWELILEIARLDGKKTRIRLEQEGGASGKSLVAGYVKALAGYHVEGVPSSGDKQVRAYNFSAQVNAGNVRLVQAGWNKRWLLIHRQFPYGKYDDEVDSTSGAFNVLTEGPEWVSMRFMAL